jgi:hypothetical protein
VRIFTYVSKQVCTIDVPGVFLFIAFTPQWLAVDLQIGNAGWSAQWHERMTARRPEPLARQWKGNGRDGWLVGRFGSVCLLKHENEEALASFYTWPVGRRRFIYTAAIALRQSPCYSGGVGRISGLYPTG